MTGEKDVLRTLLQNHVGRENAVTQSQLAEAVGLNPSTLRSELRRLREERQIPIANQRDGYYVIDGREELQAYVAHINSEIESKRRTIEYTLEAFEDFDRDEATPNDDGDGCEKCGGPIDGDPWLWYSRELCKDCHDDAPALEDDFREWVSV